MPSTDTSPGTPRRPDDPRREYAAATEWLAAKALDALPGAGGRPAAPGSPGLPAPGPTDPSSVPGHGGTDTPRSPGHGGSPDDRLPFAGAGPHGLRPFAPHSFPGLSPELGGGPPAPRALLAAAHVLGPDLLAPAAHGAPVDPATLALAAEAQRVFGAADPAAAPAAALVRAWHGWATAELLTRAGHSVSTVPPAGPPDEAGWQRWAQPMAQLGPLALPTLDSQVHRLARRRALDLARATTRAVLRRDHRAALRLTRWLAWLAATGGPTPLDLPPLLAHLARTGDGSARSALDLALTTHLAAGPGRSTPPDGPR
ncbi:hypothetical protein CFP65_4619 [Kitasatospora sp. MMS16-BH015]|uniref:hypothetical protein n=1 Tax=Kitasatospora sp. MMS16-BH015 TaxID=2018025 RepID=UPI000CA2BE20|nr:hypothetical protein [Kitasatospora sp. MMS16-BH015]AUG79354.1 hypothetical protein CFP65_4619 [Kitasatospora sp. MMS16-BH015]